MKHTPTIFWRHKKKKTAREQCEERHKELKAATCPQNTPVPELIELNETCLETCVPWSDVWNKGAFALFETMFGWAFLGQRTSAAVPGPTGSLCCSYDRNQFTSWLIFFFFSRMWGSLMFSQKLLPLDFFFLQTHSFVTFFWPVYCEE